MSKKLLLNSFSGGSSEGLTPVQNGLVCWLDAFDLSSNYSINTVWTDRSGNNNDGVVTTLFEFGSVGNGVLNAKSLVNIPNPTKELSEYTVEVGYEDVMLRYWCGLWGNTGALSTGTSCYISGDSCVSFYPTVISSSINEDLHGGKQYITVTISSTNVKMFRNGLLFYTYDFTDSKKIIPSTANNFIFMARKSNNPNDTTDTGADMLKNNWYFLRIYNRILTEEEVSNNYNYELSLERG